MSRIVPIDCGSFPWAATITVVTVILLAISWLMTWGEGEAGSPSEIRMMCLVIASWTFRSPASESWRVGSNAGMSPGVIRSMARSIDALPLPTGRIVNSQASWPSQWTIPQ